jgi:hypothetical protein
LSPTRPGEVSSGDVNIRKESTASRFQPRNSIRTHDNEPICREHIRKRNTANQEDCTNILSFSHPGKMKSRQPILYWFPSNRPIRCFLLFVHTLSMSLSQCVMIQDVVVVGSSGIRVSWKVLPSLPPAFQASSNAPAAPCLLDSFLFSRDDSFVISTSPFPLVRHLELLLPHSVTATRARRWSTFRSFSALAVSWVHSPPSNVAHGQTTKTPGWPRSFQSHGVRSGWLWSLRSATTGLVTN